MMGNNLDIFNSLVRSHHFKKASFVLFLNKKDIYEQNLEHYSLKAAFDSYSGDNSYADTIEYITLKFMACVKRKNKEGGSVGQSNFT